MIELININSGGIAKLSDGKNWRVAPTDLSIARNWAAGAKVSLAPKQDGGALWPFVLTNLTSGEKINVMQSPEPTKP